MRVGPVLRSRGTSVQGGHMLVIGLDPGTKVLGYAIIERTPAPRFVDGGIIKAKAARPIEERLAFLQGELDVLLGEHTVERAGVEMAYVGKGPQAALAVGCARGIVLASVGRRRIALENFAVPNLRARFCGSRSATKEQVRDVVGRMLRQDFAGAPLDMTDAVLLALAVSIQPLKAAG
jgi:crossover junction endodeoxyribonuclease RuvC